MVVTGTRSTEMGADDSESETDTAEGLRASAGSGADPGAQLVTRARDTSASTGTHTRRAIPTASKTTHSTTKDQPTTATTSP
jgi:hypothetical protein